MTIIDFIWTHIIFLQWASQVVLVVKSPFASAGDVRDVGSMAWSGRSLSQKEGLAIHSSIHVWRNPWTGSLAGYGS